MCVRVCETTSREGERKNFISSSSCARAYIDGWIIVIILGDVNGDFEIDVYDKVIVGARFRETDP